MAEIAEGASYAAVEQCPEGVSVGDVGTLVKK
jgi:hypothetical protein